MSVPCYFVIPAGGKGIRFGGEIPKQFLLIFGKPLIMYTLERIRPFASQIILALSSDYFDYWQELCEQYNFTVPHEVVAGGATRFESVRNALKRVPKGVLVAVHDAVRPLIDPNTISELLETACKARAALPYTRLIDSVRRFNEQGSEAVDRSTLIQVQTPQVFQSDLLIEAYNAASDTLFTDDASVYESHFFTPPALVEGNIENIKITRPIDALWMEFLLSRAKGKGGFH
ncbi:IspD/TarI family cytidylyltransferase [Porphyromonas circumdentaria]|uniref:2-C-methyl-D-erythritol 4-phosphate cytidylyltransferase n=1 Tax=Porphyromonas circumdentaria TaxID=29524 RepID=A0A1T4M4G3_9PORP|nr:2-C-methyl-D-erythritol 4-phosphate cytidylyltransferase [Porphyromonas circumdentaria]MBB6275574.1 2-C-methyl-D-erythritol 4-phosphate cytidylyltransferase [Porphyromonas circumdentaria]MDO4722131.1 2-C-methyl-D-erythritol 4-phosphate cytidylyltransferase [Porphyromonas circumdentaria]SJZ61899.1 2-C-methyl-D-erythritol 4-phosphate cytidylyltransferase [Porphyromonas circumdentaria]